MIKVSTILCTVLIVYPLCGSGTGGTKPADPNTPPACNRGIEGYWQGPHPELDHVRFIFHLFNTPDGGVGGNGFWVENGLYHASFDLDNITIGERDLQLAIPAWDCVYRGRLSGSGKNIPGVFTCTGESPDSVTVHRVDPASLTGLYADHLSSDGRFVYQYRQPKQTGDGLSTAPVSDSSLDPDVVAEMVGELATDRYGRIHSFLILKDGELISEDYFYGFDREVLHPVESVTKSITSLLLGIALDDHPSVTVDDTMGSLFPLPAFSLTPALAPVTLRQLLTMTSGIRLEEDLLLQSPDRLRRCLATEPVTPPGDTFFYTAVNTELLGGVIKRVSGYAADELAQDRLFSPLGITETRWDLYKQNGYPLCGGSLWLKPRDMVKIGWLVLENGHWKGNCIISKTWIQESIQGHVDTGIEGDGYGYHWWISDIPSGERTYRMIWANGLGSQFIFILPDLDMVMVTTGGNWKGGNTGRSWEILELLKTHLYKLDMQ